MIQNISGTYPHTRTHKPIHTCPLGHGQEAFTNHLLVNSQYAYRAAHSTEDALTDAVEWMTRRIDEGDIVAVTSIDLSRAFDSVEC